MSVPIHMIYLRCPCGAGYVLGFRESEPGYDALVRVGGRWLYPAGARDAMAMECGVCGRDLGSSAVEIAEETVVQFPDSLASSFETGDQAEFESFMRGRRYFYDPDFTAEGVKAGEKWDTMQELADLAVGRSSPTK